jgi:integrase
MAGTVKETTTAKLKSRVSRAALKLQTATGKPMLEKTFWREINCAGHPAHLGYRKRAGEPQGSWILRRYGGQSQSKNGKAVGRYTTRELGLADDKLAANNDTVLTFEQADKRASAAVAEQVKDDKPENLTVRHIMEEYIRNLENQHKSTQDIQYRASAYIYPALGDIFAVRLTHKDIQEWLYRMSRQPAIRRMKRGVKQWRPEPTDEEAKRRRRSSANRVWTMLRAALNLAYKQDRIPSDKAWRGIEPFRKVDVARIRFLTVAEAQRLINACAPDFRPLVQAGLQTGARYGELIRLEVADFNPDTGKVHIRTSKSGKPRHITLTDEGTEFFRHATAGRAGGELIFRRADGYGWDNNNQQRPMHEAVAAAKISPPISFHGLRHTWASLAIMAGMPLMVVARNLGHADTTMVQRHYGHLAEDYITKEIRAAAPRFGYRPDDKVTPLTGRR